MFNLKTFLRQAAVVLALAGSSLAALAGPVSYRVNVDTTALSGYGFLDLQFSSLLPATAATATLSNFTGGFGAIDMDDGVVYNGDGSLTLATTPDLGSYLSYNLAFGTVLGFDLLFSDDYSADTGTDGSLLTVGLFGADGTVYGDAQGIIARFELEPRFGATTSAESGFATIAPLGADVPEPSDWMLMATGLALLGASLRRRSAG